MTFELEVSLAGTNTWDGSIDSGTRTSSTKKRLTVEYTMTPTLTMPSGDYDLRSRTIDNRGQVSD